MYGKTKLVDQKPRNQLNVRKNKIGRSKPTIQAKKKIKNQVNIKFNTSK